MTGSKILDLLFLLLSKTPWFLFQARPLAVLTNVLFVGLMLAGYRAIFLYDTRSLEQI